MFNTAVTRTFLDSDEITVMFATLIEGNGNENVIVHKYHQCYVSPPGFPEKHWYIAGASTNFQSKKPVYMVSRNYQGPGHGYSSTEMDMEMIDKYFVPVMPDLEP